MNESRNKLAGAVYAGFLQESLSLIGTSCFILFFCLDTKETKNQGQPERLRPFVRPTPPKPCSDWMTAKHFIRVGLYVMLLRIKEFMLDGILND